MGRKGKELSIAKKNAIVALREADINPLQISRICGKPKSTVYNFLRRYDERETLENRRRSGRPKALTEQDKRQLFRLVRENRRRSLTEITNILSETGPFPVSESTVRSTLESGRIFQKGSEEKDANLTGK
jgi:transposase